MITIELTFSRMPYKCARNSRRTDVTEHVRGHAAIFSPAVMRQRRIFFFLLMCAGVTCAFGMRLPGGHRTRLYPHVQRMDTAAKVWRTLSAAARLTQGPDSLWIVIWNHWGDEQINPLVRIAVGNAPEAIAGNGWRYRGTIFRAENAGKTCTLESCTIIANTRNPDFTVTVPGYSVRYRFRVKATEKP